MWLARKLLLPLPVYYHAQIRVRSPKFAVFAGEQDFPPQASCCKTCTTKGPSGRVQKKEMQRHNIPRTTSLLQVHCKLTTLYSRACRKQDPTITLPSNNPTKPDPGNRHQRSHWRHCYASSVIQYTEGSCCTAQATHNELKKHLLMTKHVLGNFPIQPTCFRHRIT